MARKPKSTPAPETTKMHIAEQFEFPFNDPIKVVHPLDSSNTDPKIGTEGWGFGEEPRSTKNFSPSRPAAQPHKYQDKINSWKRDEYGLLPGVDYVFRDDGRIDWRKMIPTKYLVPNKDRFPKDTNFDELDVSTLEDNKLLILLGGVRFLLGLRGYSDMKKTFFSAGPDFVGCTCEIEFIPNYETNMQPLVFAGEADAHLNNADGWSKNFLTTIAGNRAEVRAIKNALGIEIVGKDEVSAEAMKTPESAGSGLKPHDALNKLLVNNKIKFESFKNRMIKEECEGAADWNQIEDVPTSKVFEIIAKVNKLLAERATAK